MSEQSYNSRGEVLEFTNTYLHYTVEGGTGGGKRPDRLTAVRGENATVILVEAGALRIYLDIDTAISLGMALMSSRRLTTGESSTRSSSRPTSASGILAVVEAEVDR